MLFRSAISISGAEREVSSSKEKSLFCGWVSMGYDKGGRLEINRTPHKRRPRTMKWGGSVKDEVIQFLDIIPDVSRLC